MLCHQELFSCLRLTGALSCFSFSFIVHFVRSSTFSLPTSSHKNFGEMFDLTISLLVHYGYPFLFFIRCYKQLLGSQKMFCCVLNYAVDFFEPDTHCRVSSSCGTIDKIKVSPFSPVSLFMLSAVENRVFYFCLLFLSLSIQAYLWNKKSTVRYSLCKRSADKRTGGILIPGKVRDLLYMTCLLFYHLKC